jgi:general secretion pathway protein K
MKPERQHGVAVVMALLLTALAVTIVAGLFWQQQVQVRLVENQQTRLQQEWLMRDLTDWARLLLAEDDRQSAVDYGGEAWARPLSAAPLVNAASTGGAMLLGTLNDAQARFNLNNLSDAGEINPVETAVFSRLLTHLRINGQLAQNVAASIATLQRTETGDIDAARMRIWQLDDLLTIRGFTAETVNKLRDFVVVLPRATPVNLNTAPPEILAALFINMPISESMSLVADRQHAYYRDQADFAQRMQARHLSVPAAQIAFDSRFFLLHGEVRMKLATLQSRSLIERGDGRTRVVWSREEEPSWER